MLRMSAVPMLTLALSACAAGVEREQAAPSVYFVESIAQNEGQITPPERIETPPWAVELPRESDAKLDIRIAIDFRDLGNDIIHTQLYPREHVQRFVFDSETTSFVVDPETMDRVINLATIEVHLAAAARHLIVGALLAKSEAVTEFAPPNSSKYRIVPASGDFDFIIRPRLAHVRVYSWIGEKKYWVTAAVKIRFDFHSANGAYREFSTYFGSATVESADEFSPQAAKRAVPAALTSAGHAIVERLPKSAFIRSLGQL